MIELRRDSGLRVQSTASESDALWAHLRQGFGGQASGARPFSKTLRSAQCEGGCPTGRWPTAPTCIRRRGCTTILLRKAMADVVGDPLPPEAGLRRAAPEPAHDGALQGPSFAKLWSACFRKKLQDDELSGKTAGNILGILHPPSRGASGDGQGDLRGA